MSAAAAALPSPEDIAEAFEALDDWEDRFAYLLDLAKRVPPLPESAQIEANRVHGCQSQVWVTVDLADDGRLALGATSDAMMVKGLIAVVLALFDGRTPEEARAIDAEAFVAQLGLSEHLTPGRRNGLAALLERVRTLVAHA